jgi:hypothetical protein
MATGNIKGGKRNYARPTTPTTSTVTIPNTSERVISIAFTPSTLGPQATSYDFLATKTSDGATQAATITTSGTTVTILAGGAYTATLSGKNYNGAGAGLSIGTFTVPEGYALLGTYNATETVTLGAGITKIAAYVIGAGGGGGGGGGGGTWLQPGVGAPGGGGGSGGIVGFVDQTVTPSTTVGITIGAAGTAGTRGFGQNNNSVGGNDGVNGGAGGASTVAYGGNTIATANGGGGGNKGNKSPNVGSNGNAGSGGSAGTASSNVAGANTVTGATGGAGSVSSTAGAGGQQTSNSNISNAEVTAILPSNTGFGGGGGVWDVAGEFQSRAGAAVGGGGAGDGQDFI